MAAAKKQAMNIIPPAEGYPEFARFRMASVRTALFVVGCAGVLAFFVSMVWFYHLLWTSPELPTGSTGQVVEMNNHGDLFYVRTGEALAFNLLCWGGWPAAAFSIVATMAIFGNETQRPTLLGRVLSGVLTVLVLGCGLMIFTGGRIPFGLAS
ncbi:MAG: hypothetical protein Q8R02_13840 [Hyphomonadaceae bacterium]|nr:hypothetical protein [Hyphomonadaceae bacterium]